MRIIVNNQHEATLIKKFLDAAHELGIADLMEQEDATSSQEANEQQLLNSSDYRIVAEAIFWGGPKIEVDASEDELRYEDDDWVTGTCIHCGSETMGTGDGMDPLTYERWIEMNSAESRKKWRCDSCHKHMCGNCGERTYTNEEYGECAECMARGLVPNASQT
ncbi:hypothetical protein PA598K_01434 [Paenibacillus sp. 598K]|uniref:hypothetical protein n=1 Tax=Paenibacillus sp. 598K TaxID=1117987 RepID=UPI000FFAA367|nr:hypothetical protein [Paenibacillus sp. 598K]GBF73149.1 hypothetical protein PA598K_01434 [Paenibacillus sp. 598K]